MRPTPKGFRLHIGLFGRRNVGKSSLLNALTRQTVSLVSNQAGTTTDPVEKAMELLPLGPVLFIDTAGVDDEGALGELRVARSRQILDRTDLALLVCVGNHWGLFEEDLLEYFQQHKIPVVVVFNKKDLAAPGSKLIARLSAQNLTLIKIQATADEAGAELRQAILQAAPDDCFAAPLILSDLVGAGETALLVIPIDQEAPKGRLIQPQVQVIRELLDHHALCLLCQDDQIERAWSQLKEPPRLVVCDSQVFAPVARALPSEQPLTSFSILFSRLKGDLNEQVRGALSIDALRPGDRVLIAEACTHHPIEDDIGRVKIPRWLEQRVGGKLQFVQVSGHDFPEDLSPYRLVVHCGACMWNRREMLTRIANCQQADVPITNYGLAIAHCHGILARVLEPFPAARQIL